MFARGFQSWYKGHTLRFELKKVPKRCTVWIIRVYLQTRRHVCMSVRACAWAPLHSVAGELVLTDRLCDADHIVIQEFERK